MVADIDHNIIFERKTPGVVLPGHAENGKDLLAIGEATLSIELGDNGDIILSEFTKASDMDPAHHSVIRLDAELRTFLRGRL